VRALGCWLKLAYVERLLFAVLWRWRVLGSTSVDWNYIT